VIIMKRFLVFCLAALASGVAGAQNYPTKPVKILLGFAPGGPTDVIARVIAQDLTASLGQAVIVENKTGANSLIATQEVKRAAPDGYTLLATTLAHNVNPILMGDKAQYDPIKDFAPISLAVVVPMVMVTSANSPLNSVQDVVKTAKSKPAEVTYGSAGNGGSAHLAAALLETLSGAKMTHVPFRGNAPALTEVMAGRVSFMFYPMIGIADQVAQKRLKALAISTEKRHPDFPSAPTMAEAGYPGFEAYTPGVGFVAPAGTPAPIINRLNEAIRASLAKPETQERLRAQGAMVVSASPPEEFRAWLQKDAERWAKVIKAAGVKAE
jgi:tripartite-type tricarboxylate transporter receptor subunit TctC